jgi:hypothetical protein
VPTCSWYCTHAFSILDLFFFLFALYALNTDKKQNPPYSIIYQEMIDNKIIKKKETDRTTWKEKQ